MRFKLIMAVDDHGRERSSRSPTARGITPEKTFLGLEIAGHRDHMMFLLVKQMSREILEDYCESRRVRPKTWERHRIPNCDLRF